MKVLIEGYTYDQKVVKSVLPENKFFFVGDKLNLEYVGYYRSAGCDDFVFFLPKVLLESVTVCEIPMERRLPSDAGRSYVDLAFCQWEHPGALNRGKLLSFVRPEDIVDLSPEKIAKESPLSKVQLDFLYGFSVWIYRAIDQFRRDCPDSDIVWHGGNGQSGAFRRKFVLNTLLDVVLALKRFNRDNRDYFLFRVKEKHSGLNKISWPRTIARSTAFVQEGTPVYLDLCNRKRVVNFDEELLVIFYSILNYIRLQYGFDIPINMGYELISGEKFKRYLDGYGERRLRQIKYKYFADRDVTLWELCFAFFSKAHQANVSNANEEYLIAKKFDRVFEHMIDVLIGEPDIAKFKALDDSKEIDHLYIDRNLIRREDSSKVFYIADSKYYKNGNDLSRESWSKQFTYAKDLLQLDLDLFLFGDDASKRVKEKRKVFEDHGLGLHRDPVTESYDIMPNFFISARLDSDDVNSECRARPSIPTRHNAGEGDAYCNVHFENRFFDRDTLFLSHYDVNFLYVVQLYARNETSARISWRDEVKEIFRRDIRKLMLDHFDFSVLMPHEGVSVESFFEENARQVQGRICSMDISVDEHGVQTPVFMMALESPDNTFDFTERHLSEDGRDARRTRLTDQNEEMRELVDVYFYRVDIAAKPGAAGLHLGDDPRSALKEIRASHPVVHPPVSDAQSGVLVVAQTRGPLTSAVGKSHLCPCPKILCPDDLDSVQILVLPHTQGATLFRVVEGSRQEIADHTALVALSSQFRNVFPSAWPCCVWRVEKVG